MVTAEGKVVKASESQNADLFWGIRGGGGNFGVVTSFEYKLYPVGPELFMCLAFYPAGKTKEILRKYREFMAKAPDKVNSIAIGGNIPPAPFFPAEIHGKPFFLIAGCYAGAVEEGEKALAPLRQYGETLADLSGPMPYLVSQTLFDEDYPAHKLRYYWKSIYINGLTDGAIDVIADQSAKRPSPISTLDVWSLGGVMAKVSPEATAFRNRKSPFLIGIEANWPEAKDDQANIKWVRECIERLQPFSDGSQYLNFPGFYEDGDKTLRATYGSNYDRLVALKKKYDPKNLFRLNQNIKPT